MSFSPTKLLREYAMALDLLADKHPNIADHIDELQATIEGGGGGRTDWGNIDGDIEDQTDLHPAIAAGAQAVIHDTVKAGDGIAIDHSGETGDTTVSLDEDLTLGIFADNVIDTDATMAADSDSRIPTQKAVKAALGAVAVAPRPQTFVQNLVIAISVENSAVEYSTVFPTAVKVTKLLGNVVENSTPNVDLTCRNLTGPSEDGVLSINWMSQTETSPTTNNIVNAGEPYFIALPEIDEWMMPSPEAIRYATVTIFAEEIIPE